MSSSLSFTFLRGLLGDELVVEIRKSSKRSYQRLSKPSASMVDLVTWRPYAFSPSETRQATLFPISECDRLLSQAGG